MIDSPFQLLSLLTVKVNNVVNALFQLDCEERYFEQLESNLSEESRNDLVHHLTFLSYF